MSINTITHADRLVDFNHRNRETITADRLTKARRHQANQQFRVLSTDEKISNNDTWLTRYVIRKLKQDWSPEIR